MLRPLHRSISIFCHPQVYPGRVFPCPSTSFKYSLRAVSNPAVIDKGTISSDAEVQKVAISPLQEEIKSPGEKDREKFDIHPSVDFWRNFNYYGLLDGNGSGVNRYRTALLRAASAISEKGIAFDQELAQYWGYHATRTAFFITSGLASLAFNRWMNPGTYRGKNSPIVGAIADGRALGRIIEAVAMYNQDLENVRAGFYKRPWDASLTHKQWNPFYVAYKSSQFLTDANRILTRRSTGEKEPVWLKSDMYPSYYLDTRHFQTDGWLSKTSADVYEFSTETLFVGRQDAMQRQTLIPIARFMESRDPKDAKLMDVACGTGRFLTFVKDNYPEMHVSALDLSPFYLSKARANLNYWFKHTQDQSMQYLNAEYIQAPAEKNPAPNESIDVVTCIYLFHEIPRDVRKQVAEEMFRILKFGGMVVISDALQIGDRPDQDVNMVNFQKFDEPWVGDYIHHDLGSLFESVGFECGMKLIGSSTKVLSFIKK